MEYLPIISAITALVAIVVGPVVALNVAKLQTVTARETANLQARANVLSKSRQEWINTLRKEIAGFISNTGHALPTVVKNTANGGDTLALTKEIRLHYAKVVLLVNPKEEDHILLAAKMAEIIDHLSELNFNIESSNTELAAIAQKILKREWVRVKSFE